MAPNLSEDEIDDLIYLARAGDDAELAWMLKDLAAREGVTEEEVLEAARDDGRATCLHMAAANGHSKTVTFILSLLSIKPPSSSKPSSAQAPSSSSGSLTNAGSESQQQQQSQPPSSPAQPLSSSGEKTPYIDAKNAFGNTALHWACLGGHLDVVRLLLSRGASPAAANDKAQIPLDLAAFNSHMRVVDHFLAQSRDLEGDNTRNGGEGLAAGTKDVEIDEDDEEEEGGKVSGGGGT
ncbi:hypothetical protein DL762_010399 [Monosporascus cannonballus]|uniref:Uncharacterized protein n=1 Tax=Monosporascus cannonballus TaxID=155416 RepID=A0ABY0GQW7_9PEZI|nr:hypothetical protein DL762_010399 [Monosporascus cannonballus]